MKHRLLALCSALLLTSCASVRVTHTDVATGAVNPKAIYLRPFDVSDCIFTGRPPVCEALELRKSLAPAEFTEDLKEELEEIAPALVLKDGDVPTSGWLVEGSLDVVNAGSPGLRAIPANLFKYGSSHIEIHVRVIDLDARGAATDEKDAKDAGATETHAVKLRKGAVIYEFDVAGGSHNMGKFGSTTAPGLGFAPSFDYRNAAECIYKALAPNEFRYGVRDSPTLR